MAHARTRFARRLTALILPIAAAVAGCAAPANPSPGPSSTSPNSNPAAPAIGMANPASVYCTQQGGKLEIRKDDAGDTGYCQLPDGRVVEEWEFFRASQSSAAEEPERITEKYWKLVELNGQPVPALEREPHLILKGEGGRVTGYGGCNSFAGTYTLDEAASRIRFAPLVSTERACAEGMEVEMAFHDVLSRADNFSLNGDHMTLNRARMAPLARFEVVWLR